MKIALVHDYLSEYGGAERVLKTLTEMYPEAPIYTAFCVKNSTAEKQFRGKKIVESWLAPLLKIGKFYSPLRFLVPVIWQSFDLSQYDLVITSASWYITRGFKAKKIICYCHTPPRYLYGYETSIEWQKYWPVKVYAAIVNHFLRIYDFNEAQKINHWIANSQEVKARIAKFYRKDAMVIYPPCDVENIIKKTEGLKKESYFLIASRLVGAKGIEEAVEAANKLNFKLKIIGEAAGYSKLKLVGRNVELLGRVSDEKLYELYAKAKGFIALAKEEDFGMTVIESMAAGTPVIAFYGGGFKETVVEGITGTYVFEVSITALKQAIKRMDEIKWKRENLLSQARKFSKENFIKKIKEYIENA